MTRVICGLVAPDVLEHKVGFEFSRWKLPFIWKACEMTHPNSVASLPDQRTIAFGAHMIP